MTSLLMRRPDLAGLPARPDTDVAGPADATALARLLSASFDEPWDVERVHRDLLDEPTVTAVFVVRDHDRIVATASARTLPDRYPDAGYLHWVAADPAVRGRGVGQAAVVTVLHRFAEEGLQASVLETDDHRLAAIKLYLRLGYVPQYPEPDHEGRWSAIFPRLLGRPS